MNHQKTNFLVSLSFWCWIFWKIQEQTGAFVLFGGSWTPGPSEGRLKLSLNLLMKFYQRFFFYFFCFGSLRFLVFGKRRENIPTTLLSPVKYNLIPSQFNLDDKHVNWPYSIPSGIIDTFSTKVEQPKEESWEYLQGKNSFGFKYEIVCSIGVPWIIWLSGPWKGATSDVTIAELSGVKEELKDEAFLADKIYCGDKISFIVPHSGYQYSLLEEKKAYNYLVYSACQSIECVIRQMKVFGIFHIVWKYSASFHALCTKVISKLVNLFLIFKPLG